MLGYIFLNYEKNNLNNGKLIAWNVGQKNSNFPVLKVCFFNVYYQEQVLSNNLDNYY